MPKYYRGDSSRRLIKNQIRFIGITGSITVASMLFTINVAESGLEKAARILPALAWIIGGVLHLLLPPFLIQSYPSNVQELLRYSDFHRLLARLFGILTIVLGFVVLLSL